MLKKELGNEGEVTERVCVCVWLQEIYSQPYSSIDWPAQRNNVAPSDIYTPHTWLVDLAFGEIHVYVTRSGKTGVSTLGNTSALNLNSKRFNRNHNSKTKLSTHQHKH